MKIPTGFLQTFFIQLWKTGLFLRRKVDIRNHPEDPQREYPVRSRYPDRLLLGHTHIRIRHIHIYPWSVLLSKYFLCALFYQKGELLSS